MGEVEAGDRGGRHHREAVGEGDAGPGVGLEQLEQRALLAVVRTGGIARRRADALVGLVDQGLVVQVLLRRIPPEFLADPLVQALGEGLGEPVGQRLEQDLRVRVLAVPRGLEADPGGDREGADVVGEPGGPGSDEVGQAVVRAAGGLVHLLAQEDEPRAHARAAGVRVQLDVVVDGVGREHPDDAPGLQQALVDDPPQHRLGVPEQVPGGLPDHRVLQDPRPRAGQLPGLEERRPVDAPREFVEVVGGEAEQAGLARGRGDALAPVDARAPVPRLRQRQAVGPFAAVGVPFADPGVVLADLGDQRRRPRAAREGGGDGHGARGVGHMDDRARVLGRDLHRGVRLRGGRPADQERGAERGAFHFGGDQGHLPQRRRDQAGQADHVGVVVAGRLQDRRRRHHDAEVDHLEVVAAEHDAHDVLADVVDVALHGGEHDASPGPRAPPLAGLDERLQVGDRLLHDAGALDHLGQEHLPGPEQVADPAHPVHQGPLDDLERVVHLPAGGLDVLDDVFGEPLDQGVHQALADRSPAPFGVLGAVGLALPRGPGHLEQALRGVGPPVEDDVLHRVPQGRRQVGVDGELAGVDDRHVEAGRDRVVQEHRVHGLADGVVAAERKGQVREAARHHGAGERRLDPAAGLEKGDPVGVVLLDAGRHGKDVGVEDDVLGGEADLVHEDAVGAAANPDLARGRVRLPLFVERHHDDRGAVPKDGLRLPPELRLALLEADRVDDGLALDVLEAGLEHGPARGIQHQGHAADLRLRRDEAEEPGHRGLDVEHGLVEVDVDDLGPVLDLVAGHLEGRVEVPVQHQPPEAGGPRDVGALADVHEAGVRVDGERLEAGEEAVRHRRRRRPRRHVRDGVADRGDVFRRGPAAAAREVEPPVPGEFAEVGGHRLRGLVVAAEGVGEAGVGIQADRPVGEVGDLLQVRPQVPRAQRAVEADREGPGMAHGRPERGRRLAGEGPARRVRDRARDHDRETGPRLVEGLGDGVQRGLGVEGVEDRLDQEKVRAALDQAERRRPVGQAEFAVGDAAGGRVLHHRRHRRRPVGRAQDAGHEARSAVAFVAGGRLPRDAGRRVVDLPGQVPGPVVGLGDGRRAERAGADDVGADPEVGLVHVRHDVRAGEAEDVEVARQVGRVVPQAVPPEVALLQVARLQHGAERAVEHQDALPEALLERAPPDGRTGARRAHAPGPAGAAPAPRSPSHQQMA